MLNVNLYQPVLYPRMKYNSQRKREEEREEGKRKADRENIGIAIDSRRSL